MPESELNATAQQRLLGLAQNLADSQWPSKMNPHPKLALVTSWDDGHPLDLRIAEMLARHGLSGTFYVPARSHLPLLHRAEIRQLSKEFELGAHGMESLELTKVSNRVAYAELADSRKWVEDVTGKPCGTFCFPRGHFFRRHLWLASLAGYTGVRTVELMSLEWPARISGLDIIPTTVQVFARSPAAYFRNFAKRLSVRNACTYLRHARSANWVSAANSVLASAAHSGGVFHLWGHSWEIEETRQWNALEEILACMATYKKDAVCMTAGDLCDYGR
jgi:peptidoglycan/xylan/chitin deacetylase (PgdA/CDA1 family)